MALSVDNRQWDLGLLYTVDVLVNLEPRSHAVRCRKRRQREPTYAFHCYGNPFEKNNGWPTENETPKRVTTTYVQQLVSTDESSLHVLPLLELRVPYHSSLSSRSPLYSTASSAVCSLQRDRDVVMDVGPTMSQLFCFFTFYVPAVRMWSHRRFVCMLLLVNQYSQAHNTRTKNSYTHWARTLYVLRTANTRWNVPHTHT